MTLYPLRFKPIYKYRIWGGNKLKTVLNKTCTAENIGESWEISTVPNDVSIVSEGSLKGTLLTELLSTYGASLVGRKTYEEFGNEFPVLIKFIDAKTPLSIQVHPNNDLAQKRHNSFGKNEMWHVIDADKDAELIIGFDKLTTEKEYLKKLNDGSILDILNTVKVHKGDTYYIPTGRIHAIGAGVLLAEIQQTSDITYRIFDYNRVDKNTGKERELHTELALDAIDYKVETHYKTDYKTALNTSNKLVHSPYFSTNIIALTGSMEKDYKQLDSFFIYICVEGTIKLFVDKESYTLNFGETILLPASTETVLIKSENAKIIEVSMPTL